MLPGGTRTLPAWVDDGWDGLRRFVHYTVRDSSGTVVYKLRTGFCPDGYDLQRLSPSGPLNPTFPEFCGDNPFTLGAVWGIDRGWAVGLDDNAPEIPLADRPLLGDRLDPAAVRRALPHPGRRRRGRPSPSTS